MSDERLREARDALVQVIQNGDEDALDEVARRYMAGDPESVRAAATAATHEAASFREAAAWFKEEYSDLIEDPLTYARVKEIDTALAQKNPESKDFKARLRTVGNMVRRERDGDEEGDRRAAVKEMVKIRHGVELDSPDDETSDDPFERENSEIISSMAKERRRAQGFED